MSPRLLSARPGCRGKVPLAFCHVVFHGLLAYEFITCHYQASSSFTVFGFFLSPFTNFFVIPDQSLQVCWSFFSLPPFCCLQQP